MIPELFDIRHIAGKDVTILKMCGASLKYTWYCAYVRIENPHEDEYHYETYRKGNVIGIDTAHGWNISQTYEEKLKDAEIQIENLIEEARAY